MEPLKGIYTQSVVGGYVGVIVVPDPRPGKIFAQAETFDALDAEFRKLFTVHFRGTQNSGNWEQVRLSRNESWDLTMTQTKFYEAQTYLMANFTGDNPVNQQGDYCGYRIGKINFTLKHTKDGLAKPELITAVIDLTREALARDPMLTSQISLIMSEAFSNQGR